MADPLAKEINNLSQLKFAKLYSPKMKSVYWKYFGFPTNEEDRIITKQNVVCTLCHRVLTNHGNTTNLRAHLQYRHKDVFQKVLLDNDIKLPARKVVPMNKTPGKRGPRKIKLEYQDSLQGQHDSIAFPTHIEGDSQSMLYETEIPMTYDDEDELEREQFATVEVIKEDVKPFRKAKYGSSVHREITEYGVVEQKNLGSHGAYHLDVLEDCDAFQFQDSLVNMLVQDMLNVRSLYEPGMSQLLKTLAARHSLPPEQKMESLIKEMHSDKLTTISAQIKAHSQMKPYSFGFDIWRNLDKKHYVSAYFNYIADMPHNNNTLLNQLYCTFEYNSFTSLDAIFSEFNLDNCTAAVVNYDYDDYLKQFLRSKNIAVIVAYDVVIDKCVHDVLTLPSVAPIIEEIKEVIMRYMIEINSRDMEVPNFNEDFPWTGFELLKFFTESVAWPEDVEALMAQAKTITNKLNTLLITLDTLKAEDIPLSSMLSPITAKIMSKSFSPSETDDSVTAEIKATISKILETFVSQNDHLTIAAVLDPRFHRLTNSTNFNKCLKILTEKHSKLAIGEGYTVTPKQEVQGSTPTNSKKSNLEIFFDIEDITNISTADPEESSVENDLKRYRKEVHVNLDESPVLWWNRIGHIYGSLRTLAQCYQCVPCTVNIKNFKKPMPQQIHEAQQRFMLTGSVIDAMLFLRHYNK